MILCITPNPALDRTLMLPTLRRGEVQRPARALMAAGGKGLNVARCLRALGGQARCAGPLGGHAGRLLAELAEREGLAGAWTWAEGETRTCTIIVEDDGESTGIYEPGQPLDAAAWARLCADVLREAREAEGVCICGSLPPGISAAMLAELIAALREGGAQVWVDTSGPALEAAAAAHPHALKVNAEEAGAMLGCAIRSPEDAGQAASALRARGVETAVITLGGAGAVLSSAEGAWHASAPAVQAISAVGSGDAFLAGMLHAIGQGQPPAQALRVAVAAGAANAAALGVAQFTDQQVRALAQSARLTPLG